MNDNILNGFDKGGKGLGLVASPTDQGSKALQGFVNALPSVLAFGQGQWLSQCLKFCIVLRYRIKLVPHEKG